MKVNRLLLTLAVLSVGSVQAQTTEKKNHLSFSVGTTYGFLKNLEFAPVVKYEYRGPTYQLHYTHVSKKENLFDVKFDYVSGALQADKLPNLNTDYEKINLGFSYLKKVYGQDRWSAYVGIQSLTSVSIYDNPNTTVFNKENYYTFHQELGIGGKLQVQFNDRHGISTQLSVPLLLFRATNAESKIHSIGKYQSVVWNLEYGFKVSRHFDLKAAYHFNYARLQVPSAYRELQHQFNLGINYKF